MKRMMLTGLIGLLAFHVLGQGKNISLAKKSITPIVTRSGDTIEVGDEIMLFEGSNEDGSFKYIQDLNSFNEPIQSTKSRMAFKKQKIKFFKEQDGTTYVFTKFFVINIEAALHKKEIEITKLASE